MSRKTEVTRLRPLRATVSEAEWQARVDLAGCYRLCDLYSMSDLIYTHISARVPDEPDHFLINPHGMLFDEISDAALLKVDLDGKVAYQRDAEYGLHAAGLRHPRRALSRAGRCGVGDAHP